LGMFTNLNGTSGYFQKNFDLMPFKGQTVRIRFLGKEDEAYSTSFLIDDVTLNIKR
jgi:hypothetical protein